MNYQRVIKDNLDTLLRCTNLNVHIIACLRAEDALTEDQVSEIISIQSLRSRCQTLYDWMSRNYGMFVNFVKVMEENEQEHVSNLLRGNINGGVTVPLSDDKYHRLDKIKPKLMIAIHFNEELLSNLQSKDALSKTDCQDIRYGKTQPYEQNYALINAIQRRSEYSFQCLREALIETHQRDAAAYMEKGEMVTAHLNTNVSLDVERHLYEEIKKDILAESTSDYSAISELSEHNLCLVGARPDNSILLYFYCSDTSYATIFAKSYSSGLLKFALESMLNRIIDREKRAGTLSLREHLEISLSFDLEEALLIEEITGLNVLKANRHSLEKHPDFELKALNASLKKRKEKLLEPDEPGNRYIISSRQTSLIEASSVSKDAIVSLQDEIRLERRLPLIGMTVLKNDLYVVYHHSSTIDVYDCIKHHSKGKKRIEIMVQPKDVVSCSTCNCIYILNTQTDRTSMEIIKIDATNHLVRWRVPSSSHHLSVFNSKVLLTIIVEGQPQILEYTSNGSLLRATILRLPNRLSDFHAQEIHNDLFVCITVGVTLAKRELLIINTAGEVLKSVDLNFEKWEYSREENRNYVIVDSKGDVLLSDKCSSTIWYFDSNLEKRKELITMKHRLTKPDRIAFDESGDRLFAMNLSEALVQVLSIR